MQVIYRGDISRRLAGTIFRDSVFEFAEEGDVRTIYFSVGNVSTRGKWRSRNRGRHLRAHSDKTRFSRSGDQYDLHADAATAWSDVTSAL